MTKTEKLLKVLDMPEEEQWTFLCKNGCLPCPWGAQFECNKDLWRWGAYFHREVKDEFQAILADLAFRLRDEASTNYLPEALCVVHEHIDIGVNKMYSHSFNGARSWFCFLAKPIHWIIAALIVKEMPDGK